FDDTHGSGSHNVIFRNRSLGWQSDRTGGNATPVMLEIWNKYISIIGNVLGKAGFPPSSSSMVTIDRVPNYTGMASNSGNIGSPSLYRNGNWDVATGRVIYG